MVLAGAGAGMVVASGVAAVAAWPHDVVEVVALWACWWCAVGAFGAALGLYWWEDEELVPTDPSFRSKARSLYEQAGEDGPA